MTIAEETVILERPKLLVKENTEVFTVMHCRDSKKELLKMGIIYPHEMNNLYVGRGRDNETVYDENHIWVDINGANFIIRKEDLL